MLIDVTLPQLGESVNEGTISKWLVREGDVVKKDQALVSIATDKADSELPAPAAGRVTKLLAAERVGLPQKGRLKEGADADITVFDAAKVEDKATYESPAQYAAGIPWVVVNGVPVVRNGQLQTGIYPGKGLRH